MENVILKTVDAFIVKISLKYRIKNKELKILWDLSNVIEKQDTGKFRKNIKDQFYTDEKVSKKCINDVLEHLSKEPKDYLWVEPSAGNGSFLHNIPSYFKKIGFDLEPKTIDIQQQDYLKWNHFTIQDKHVIVFGNPPFGRQSTLAKSFIIKSCEFATIIAFILPKSFTKPSMYNVFNIKFHLIYSVELEKNSFILNGKKYDVPCVFQIWEKKDIDRIEHKKVNPIHFKYVKQNEIYDIAFRRVGGLAGKCYKNNGSKFSSESHHFIKVNDEIEYYIDDIIEKINIHTFPSNTVGPRSLSKTEINTVLNDIIHSLSF